MAISVFELFSIGIGPSSSHTVGPMRAACRFVKSLQKDGHLTEVHRIKTELFGSLGATGKGHGSDKAVMLGFEGELPESVDTTIIDSRLASIRQQQKINLLGEHSVAFNEQDDLTMHRKKRLPFHSNGMTFSACDRQGNELSRATFYSVGGGFIVDETATGSDRIKLDDTVLPYPFLTAVDLLIHCANHDMRISDVMMENEKLWRSEDEIRAGLLNIWKVMQTCVSNGCRNEGILPGGLKVKRRAADLFRKLTAHPDITYKDPLTTLDWVNLYALAVNEENASISGSEVGCQGEVGSACSMAAGALTEVLGGTPEQVEYAAEIGMEHNLGLTCDPIGGLVQVPCIERNAMASIKAINAS